MPDFSGNSMTFRLSGGLLTLCSLGCLAAEPASLFSNSDFETGSGTQVSDWPMPAGTSWEAENGNHFLRLKAPTPGTSITVYRQIPIQGGTKLTLTGRFRWNDVVRGAEKWHDARLLVEFKGADDKKYGPAPAAVVFVGSSAGWEEKTVAITVPFEAVTLAVMPAMFQVQGGTLDIDDLRLVAAP
jgi:hypothetical protein